MAVIYLFSPQLKLLAAYEAAQMVHSEASYQITAEFKADREITTGFVLGFSCVDGRFRLFELDEVDYRDTEFDLYVSGTDLAVRALTDIVVEDIRCINMTAPAALAHLLEASLSGWTVGDVITTDALSSRHYYKSLWECVVSLMDRYGVRMVPYFVLDSQGVITARKIDILSAEPVYRGRFFESGDDAGSVTVTVTGNPKTALYGRGKGVETGETESGDTTYGPRLTFADVVWSTANGDPVDKPLHQEWVGDPEALVAFGRDGKHRFGVAVFEEITDPEALLRATWDYLQTICWPNVACTATVYDMEMAEGHTWAAVRVNDLAIIRPRLFPADVTAKITQIHRDYVNPANTRLEISSTGVNVSASSLYSATTKKLDAASTQLQTNVITRNSVIDTMVTKIMSSGTNMYTDPESGAFVFESADGSSAMMLTGAGWMISDEKVGENWQWRTAATGDGIVADEITTGMLQASVVRIFGSDHFYWDADNIYIKEGTGQEMILYGVTLTKTGGTVRQYYYGPSNVSSAVSRVTFWTNNMHPPANSIVYVECDSTDGTFYLNWYNPSGASTQQYTFGPSYPTARSFNIGSSSYSCWITNTGANITNLRCYIITAQDETDVGTTWDLGDLEIPATENAWSGVAKSACTLGVYELHVTAISPDAAVKLSTVNLSTAAETQITTVTQGDLTLTFSRSAAFDLMYGRSAPSLRQIRIGCYDGTNYGIAFSSDGGETWTTAIDFNGINVSGEMVALRTAGGYIDIRNNTFSAGAASAVNIQSGGSFNCQAGSNVSFITNDFAVKNAEGKNMLAIGATEDKEGQIVLGDEGFPVNFTEDFILPVKNGGTGYNSGQIHRVTGNPPAGLGIDGDLAIRFASSSGAYAAFTPSITDADTKAGSNVAHAGFQRYWNCHNWVDSAIPSGTWAAGNDNGYCYGVYGVFTSPSDPVRGVISIQLTGYKYYNNSSGLTAYIADSSGAVLGSASVLLPYRTAEMIVATFSSLSLAAATQYQLLICDSSATRGNTSKAYITKGSISFPAYAGSTACGLYIKSAGSWVTVFTT